MGIHKMKEKLINYDNLPLCSVWDGSPIRRTVNCNDCKYLVNVHMDKKKLEICDWGVAWKVLTEVKDPGKCVKINKNPPKGSSLYKIQKIL